MRVTCHNRVGMKLRLIAYCLKQPEYTSFDFFYFVEQIHTNIERDLIVTAACRMKPFAGVSDTACQYCLDIHMDILGVDRKLLLSILNIGEYLAERRDYLFGFALLDNSAFAKHSCVRNRTVNILTVHTSVKGNRRIEVVYTRIDIFFKTSLPEFHISFSRKTCILSFCNIKTMLGRRNSPPKL